MEPTFSGGLMALLFAVVTGTVFGFYPALRASMLVPIEALNQD
jgi:putative ABC transport system permease protein